MSRTTRPFFAVFLAEQLDSVALARAILLLRIQRPLDSGKPPPLRTQRFTCSFPVSQWLDDLSCEFDKQLSDRTERPAL